MAVAAYSEAMCFIFIKSINVLSKSNKTALIIYSHPKLIDRSIISVGILDSERARSDMLCSYYVLTDIARA